MALDKRVGENIRSIRTRKGFSQQQVADAVGVTKQTVSKIERNGSASPKTLMRIANMLNVDVSELYEPPREKPFENSYADFVTDDEMKILIADYAKPLIKAVNDAAAKNIYRKIDKMRELYKEKIDSAIKETGIQTDTYTRKQVKEISAKLYVGFLGDVINILHGIENDALY